MITPKSLRFRLLAAWSVFLLLTLQPAAIGLGYLFKRSISRGAISELAADLQVIAGALGFDEAGNLKLSEAPLHPRFLLAYGGRYWQVSENGTSVMRSPSLWDQTLTVDVHPHIGDPPVVAQLSGPSDQSLLGLVQRIVAKGAEHKEFEIVTAIDQAEIMEEKQNFTYDIVIGLAGFGALFLLAALAQVYIGLSPLNVLRSAVAAIRSGAASRIEGSFPDEVMPIIDETNALLVARDEAFEIARARAGNLAHGLKTPLAIMAAQSRLMRRSGHNQFADEVDKQIEQMRWHVERELVLSRHRNDRILPSQTRLDLSKKLVEIVSALKKLPRSRELDWSVSVEPGLLHSIGHADFSDIMGNVFENAQKWAKSRVCIDARRKDETFAFTVDDDGPGVEKEHMERIIRRGERADATVPGTGLGLAIVNELAGLYGGHLELSRSPLGGLRVIVDLPRSATGRKA